MLKGHRSRITMAAKNARSTDSGGSSSGSDERDAFTNNEQSLEAGNTGHVTHSAACGRLSPTLLPAGECRPLVCEWSPFILPGNDLTDLPRGLS